MKKALQVGLGIVLLSMAGTTTKAQWNLTGNSNATATSYLGTTNGIALKLGTKNTTRLTIDSNGKVGIATAPALSLLTIKGAGSTPASSWISNGAPLFAGFGEATPGNADFNLMMAATVANARGVVGMKRARGTLAAPAAVAANDQLGSLLVSGYDGTNFQGSAAVDFFADGTPTTGNVPARISFVTGTNGSNRAERLKIGNTGDITMNTNQLFVQKSSGKVGIGTISPSNKLTVAGNANVTGIVGIGESNPQGALHVSQPFNFAGITFTGTGPNDLSTDISGYTGTGRTNYAIRIENSGPTPNKIEVSNDGGATWAASVPIANPVVLAKGVTATFANTGGHTFGARWDWTANQSFSNTLLVQDGGVGINGPSLSNYGLNINGSVTQQGMIVGDVVNGSAFYSSKSGLNTSVSIQKTSTSSGTSCLYASNAGSGPGVESYSTDGVSVSAFSNSYIGVYAGTSSSTSYAGYFSGNVYTTGAYQSSDARLKKNITDFNNGMDILNQLQPKHYEFRTDGNYGMLNLPIGTHYGLIAQDLEKVLPQLVKDASVNTNMFHREKLQGKEPGPGEMVNFKAVNYTELIPIMIKGMQELSAKNEALETKNEELKKDMADLKALVQQLLSSKGTAPCPPMAGK